MIYSHSRLACFEQCPKKFEYKYIQRIVIPEKVSIEAFMGKAVHSTLEKLFRDLQHTKKNSLHELLAYYEKIWNEDWNDEIAINKEGLTKEHYFELGKKCVTNFYEKNHPFEKGKVLGIEQKITLDLNGDGKHKLTGYIDLFMEAGKNHFQIHDYKTYGKLPEQSKIEKDEQLAIYQMWVEKEFPEAKKVDLIWHYVVFQREGISHRNKAELEKIKKRLIGLINKIESTEHYQTNSGPLCSYCSYKPICPAWAHGQELKKLEPKQYSQEEGVKLADAYAKVYQEKKALMEKIENEMDSLKAQIFDYAKQHGYEVVQGTTHTLKLKSTERLKFPSKGSKERTQLDDLIKKHNFWMEVSELDTHKMGHYLQEGIFDKNAEKELKKYIDKTETKMIFVSKLK
ncbi:MAG TPA: PD-(D/E)XK nuclease family protein [archaeon]|nr:PD-(D/E)XK nuclease family protein [archaeon]